MQPQVFEFHDPVEFLNASLQSMQAKNPSFSLRAWSKQLGLRNVAMLSMVLNRKRRLLPSLSTRISGHLRSVGRFSDVESRYFEILTLFNNAGTLEEKNFYEGILSGLKPDQSFSTLELDQIKLISEWYHVAILEMTELKNFNSDLQWICLKLGDSVNKDQAKTAIERLLRLELLEKDSAGVLQKSQKLWATPSDIPHEGLKKFHVEMIQKSLTALATQNVKKRDITNFTFTIDTKKIPAAKLMIRDFRRKLAKFLETPGGDAVYQLNIQLFDLLGGSHANSI